MKLIVRMIREIFKMLNQYAVDNPTLPVNLRFSHRAAKYLGHAWNTGKRFLQIPRRLLQHLVRKSPTPGFLMCQNTHHHM